MATKRINKTNVEAVAPSDKAVMLWDDRIPGFGLKVTPAGTKTYLFQYRLGGRSGRTRRFTIGKHGALTADNARREADRLATLVRQGVDPQQEKQDTARRAVDLAFKGYAETFIEDCLKIKWKASHKDGEALLRRYAIPILGNKALPDIDRADIRAVLKPVKRKVATCRNLFAVLRRLFRWAVSEGDLDASPIVGMEPPPLPPKRDRKLSDLELKLVWNASATLGYPFGPLFRLLLITGQRLEEVSGLKWSEVDRDNSLWSLPAGRAKNGNASLVHLPDLAVAELDALAKRKGRTDGWPKRGLIFTTTGETSVSGHSRAKARLDREVGKLAGKQEDCPHIEHWRLHDLRRTLATGMQRLGVRFEVTEAILNHVSGSKSGVAGVYQLHDWGPEKVKALNSWAGHIKGVLSQTDQSNVIPLASVRA